MEDFELTLVMYFSGKVQATRIIRPQVATSNLSFRAGSRHTATAEHAISVSATMQIKLDTTCNATYSNYDLLHHGIKLRIGTTETGGTVWAGNEDTCRTDNCGCHYFALEPVVTLRCTKQ